MISTMFFSFHALFIKAEDIHYQGALAMKPVAELKLWQGSAPGEKAGTIGEEKTESGKETPPISRIRNVTEPTLAVYQPDSGKATGTCILVFPGGGYSILAYNHEGTEIAHWLNSIGITAVVVKYRVPRRAGHPKHLAPLQDAQRAIRLVRQNAETWKIDARKTGVLGFSAGAHLALMLATGYNEKSYESVDSADQLSARPDFAVPVYLAYALGEKVDQKRVDVPLAEDIRVTRDTPPMFLSVCDDDPVGSMGSVQLYMKLRATGIPCELHVFVKGGHGYGIRSNRGPAAGWNRLCEDWLKQMNL
ncbi:MAG: alpha/beta hydrolase [Opitutaceae bacterium]|nr:alpha/beta hydrolase [Opitutaceae bacterium]